MIELNAHSYNSGFHRVKHVHCRTVNLAHIYHIHRNPKPVGHHTIPTRRRGVPNKASKQTKNTDQVAQRIALTTGDYESHGLPCSVRLRLMCLLRYASFLHSNILWPGFQISRESKRAFSMRPSGDLTSIENDQQRCHTTERMVRTNDSLDVPCMFECDFGWWRGVIFGCVGEK